MDKESLWILKNLSVNEISARSADRMLRALKLLRQQEQRGFAVEWTSEQQVARAEMPHAAKEATEEETAQDVTKNMADGIDLTPKTIQDSTVQDWDIHVKAISRCSECGVVNAPGAVRCDNCGTSLVKPITSSAEPVLPTRLQDVPVQIRSRIPQLMTERLLTGARKIQEKHRLVTAMFADVSGVSGMARAVPPEMHVSIMSNCLNVMVDTIFTKYEGCISHITGDRVLAFFGAPRTHEDDAERAIRAALDIRACMRDLHLDVSIGINTGVIHIVDMSGDLCLKCHSWSPEIDLADMLQDAASPGEIWVGFSTHKLTDRRFDFGSPTDVIARGLAGPQKAYPVLGVSDYSEQPGEIDDPDVEMMGETAKSNVCGVFQGKPIDSKMQREPYNILLVDDDARNLDSLKRIFGQEYNVFSATSGEEALRIMAQNDVAIIITDHRMPGMTGIELLERALQDYPDTVRVLLAAYTDEDLLIGAISRAHVHSFLPKPWEPEEVKAVVGEAIKTYKSLQTPGRIPGNERETLGEIMVENGLISREQLDRAMQESSQKPGEELDARETVSSYESGANSELQLAEKLIGLGYIDEKAVILCYALQLGADYRLLSQLSSIPELAGLLPLRLAHRYSIIPVNAMGRALILAAQKPLSDTAKMELEEKLGRSVIVRAISDV